MLSVVDKKGRVIGPLGADDGHAMLAAFAQSGAGVEARERGADVVRATQQKDCWFRCDCLGTGASPNIAATGRKVSMTPEPGRYAACLCAPSTR